MQDKNSNTQFSSVTTPPTAGTSGVVASNSAAGATAGNGTQVANGAQAGGGAKTATAGVAGSGAAGATGMNATTGVLGAAGVARPGQAAAGQATNGGNDEKKTDTKKPAQSRGSLGLPSSSLMKKIVDKVRESENILVALSRDPSVDEMAAAIGLTLFLDEMQKHATAIYSGQTPMSLDFLQPEGTFESNTDSLQDFIITIDKEKADHLRYKLEGDFVKVYITPYKTTITESDLEFSHGDYNVDLVLALGVPQATDLDEALAEYGRIMHDATIVDITCDAPGRFGEIEWSDPGASSVSEMVTKLILALQGPDAEIDQEVAMALLTGIVAATGRFSNERTNSETMQIASKLMSMGADQQLIAAHVMGNDVAREASEYKVERNTEPVTQTDETNLLVGKDYNLPTAEPVAATGTVVQPDVPMAAVDVNRGVASGYSGGIAAQNGGYGSSVASGTMTTGSTATGSTMTTGGVKDYAQMMAQALAEPTPGQSNTMAGQGMGAMQGAGVQSATMSLPNMQQSGQTQQMTQGTQAQVAYGTRQGQSVGAYAQTQGQNMVQGHQGQGLAQGQNPAMMAAPAEASTTAGAAQAVMQTPAGNQAMSGSTLVLPPPPAPKISADMMPPTMPK